MKFINIKKPTIILLGIFIMAPIVIECESSDDNFQYAKGYIVGFDPCTINHQYRIGYVIVSNDLSDTLVTYNISDRIYKMPASIINGTDTLYSIQESFFQNYINSAYFPESVRYAFKIRVTYRKADQDETNYNVCTSDINQHDFSYQFEHNQVIIKSASGS